MGDKHFDSITELEEASRHKLLITSIHSLSHVVAKEVAIYRFGGIYLNTMHKEGLKILSSFCICHEIALGILLEPSTCMHSGNNHNSFLSKKENGKKITLPFAFLHKTLWISIPT